MTETVLAGITLETSDEADVLILSLAMAEAAMCGDEAVAGLTMTLAANLLAEADPSQKILQGLTAKVALAACTLRPFQTVQGRKAFALLLSRVRQQEETK